MVSSILKFGFIIVTLGGLAFAVVSQIQSPSCRRRRKLHSAMRAVNSAVKDIASMVK